MIFMVMFGLMNINIALVCLMYLLDDWLMGGDKE